MIVVLGDIMLDKYTFGSVDRINPEAPVPILNAKEETFRLGGAANVANNISSLKCKVLLIGICNDNDLNGKKIIELCKQNNIDHFFVNDGRPTTVKHRFIAKGYNQQILRVDYEQNHIIDEENAIKIIKKIKEINPEYIIISDYAKGCISEFLISKLKEDFSQKMIVDSKPQNMKLFKDVFLIKPNLKETEAILQRKIENEDNEIEKAALELKTMFNTNIVITRSEKGATIATKNQQVIHIPGIPREVHDVAGAGDTFIATLAFGLANKKSLIDSVVLANKASSIVVGKIGTSTVSLEELFQNEK